MRRLAACLVAFLVLLSLPGAALAARITLLRADGHARVLDDRYLPSTADTPLPVPSSMVAPGGGGQLATPTASAAAARARHLTVPRRLSQLEHAGAITRAESRSDLGVWRSALWVRGRLRGIRRAELGAVIANLAWIAARHELTAGRLPVLFLTLQRNVRWWSRGPLLSPGARVEFAGSQLVWEYYPGQGLALQVLGSFGEADGLYAAGRSHWGQLQALLDELMPLAVHRAGGLAWEYYFSFDGGQPPWVSGMAQGTALEALTRAYRATGQKSYLTAAHEVLGILRRRPETGVAVPEPAGTRFLQYSFAPRLDIINAFLQTLIGLYDYASYSGDPVAAQLFQAGNAEAQAELPQFDTGAWSLYQPGVEDDLSYHELVTGFLEQLCSRTHAAVYCRTAQHFQAYLHTPPVLTQLTRRAIARRRLALRFRLSKISHVGIVILRGGATVIATSATFPYGVHDFAVPPLRRGTYAVHLAATDLAGNFHRSVGSLVVAPRRRS
ncbi:MAG TPA: D-glucuronyl C5-epimerase family protein [Solirubrobacteraceae bacterium]|nr:D-glucuronyl C5-epimerase family protein [Solirubrobacteraceae bacterium]